MSTRLRVDHAGDRSGSSPSSNPRGPNLIPAPARPTPGRVRTHPRFHHDRRNPRPDLPWRPRSRRSSARSAVRSSCSRRRCGCRSREGPALFGERWARTDQLRASRLCPPSLYPGHGTAPGRPVRVPSSEESGAAGAEPAWVGLLATEKVLTWPNTTNGAGRSTYGSWSVRSQVTTRRPEIAGAGLLVREPELELASVFGKAGRAMPRPYTLWSAERTGEALLL